MSSCNLFAINISEMSMRLEYVLGDATNAVFLTTNNRFKCKCTASPRGTDSVKFVLSVQLAFCSEEP